MLGQPTDPPLDEDGNPIKEGSLVGSVRFTREWLTRLEWTARIAADQLRGMGTDDRAILVREVDDPRWYLEEVDDPAEPDLASFEKLQAPLHEVLRAVKAVLEQLERIDAERGDTAG